MPPPRRQRRVRRAVCHAGSGSDATCTTPAASRPGRCRPPPDRTRSRAAAAARSARRRGRRPRRWSSRWRNHRPRCRWHNSSSGMRDRPLRTDLAGHLLGAYVARQTRCGAEKSGLAHATLTIARPLLQMLRAQIRPARAGSLTAGDHAIPPIDLMPGRDLDHVRAEDRIEGGARRSTRSGSPADPGSSRSGRS